MRESVPHNLGQDRAKDILKLAFESYKKALPQYQPLLRWIGENNAEITVKTHIAVLKGHIEVQEKMIHLNMKVPFLLLPFRKQAVELIKKEIFIWIKKAN
jgi:hypothetical protein